MEEEKQKPPMFFFTENKKAILHISTSYMILVYLHDTSVNKCRQYVPVRSDNAPPFNENCIGKGRRTRLESCSQVSQRKWKNISEDT